MWSPCGRFIVYTGWQAFPRKLGSAHCYQRPCALYAVNVEEVLKRLNEPKPQESEDSKAKSRAGTEPKPVEPSITAVHVRLTPHSHLSRCARFNHAGSQLAFLTAPRFQGHNNCFGIGLLDWNTDAVQAMVDANSASAAEAAKAKAEEKALDSVTSPLPAAQRAEVEAMPECLLSQHSLVDIVDIPADADAFPGVYCSRLARRCWSLDDKQLFFNTQWGASMAAVCVDTTSGALHRVSFKAPLTAAERGLSLMPWDTDSVRGLCCNHPTHLFTWKEHADTSWH